VTELKYKFTYDTLFKMLFVKYPELLKRLVAAALGIAAGNIAEFVITNPEIPPDALGDKFCRLDINMTVDGSRVDLEVQVEDEGDYPERSLYHWARGYSSALQSGGEYSQLPRVIIISILDESVFNCAEYHSEFQPLEVTRHTPLTDRMALHYFEVRKLPRDIDVMNELQLMLSLFRAKTEEELKRLEGLGVSVVTQAIEAYREVTISPEFKELERLRSLARHNEASALAHARREAVAEAEAKWQGVVIETETKWQGVVIETETKWQGVVADKDAALADKDAEIARLRAQLEQRG
jgi:predicted transposase/invertase (TIGR01784 family)